MKQYKKHQSKVKVYKKPKLLKFYKISRILSAVSASTPSEGI
ncbi:MAG TPA: hypothetical protein PLC32_05555 [Candidatus Omnitrophota bacterium]|nr:hypothetical protein [Candidatus Omnitrophota bacterium]